MNELRRLAYLAAMGADSYVCRQPLPGAAPTRRLALARVESRAPPAEPTARAASAGPAEASAQQDAVPRFSLAAMVAGGWLWLEELDGMPLASEQVHLVQAMALALGGPAEQAARPSAARPSAARPIAARPAVAQFNWPIHTNQQLDIGLAAARSGVAGFVQRKLEELDCRGLVLLGAGCEARVPLDQLNCPLVVRTVSTASMLGDPQLKKRAWQDLRPFCR